MLVAEVQPGCTSSVKESFDLTLKTAFDELHVKVPAEETRFGNFSLSS